MGGKVSKVIHFAERIVFPPLVIEDVVLNQAKAEFNTARKKLQDAVTTYNHELTVYGTSLKDMHTKLIKLQFIIGHLKNEPNFSLPNVNLSKFNDEGWQIAALVTNAAIQVAVLISMVLPEPLGFIAAIVIPVVGDIIQEGEKIGKYKDETNTMKSNLNKVTDALSQLRAQQAKNHQESVDLDSFNDQALQAIGEADWSNVEDDKSLKFNESLDALATATPDTIHHLADQLLSKQDRDQILALWNSKEKLQRDIEAVK